MTDVTYTNFDKILVDIVPEFNPWYERHLLQNDEILPYLLMGELVVFIKELCIALTEQSEVTLSYNPNVTLGKVMSFLELVAIGTKSDTQLDNLIGTGFLENLHKLKRKQYYLLMKDRAGSRFRAMLKEEEGFWPARWLRLTFDG